jgi:hypothetical protein
MFKYLLIGLMFCVIACSTATQSSRVKDEPKQKLSFIDLANFDRELADSLNSEINLIEVGFYEKVSPNKIPERLQKWISVIEQSGGKLKIEPPPNEPTPKNALTILSLLGSAYSAIKDQSVSQGERLFTSVKGRNAVISLERGLNGELLVNKIQFTK